MIVSKRNQCHHYLLHNWGCSTIPVSLKFTPQRMTEMTELLTFTKNLKMSFQQSWPFWRVPKNSYFSNLVKNAGDSLVLCRIHNYQLIYKFRYEFWSRDYSGNSFFYRIGLLRIYSKYDWKQFENSSFFALNGKKLVYFWYSVPFQFKHIWDNPIWWKECFPCYLGFKIYNGTCESVENFKTRYTVLSKTYPSGFWPYLKL
jgi:hypothetical protein